MASKGPFSNKSRPVVTLVASDGACDNRTSCLAIILEERRRIEKAIEMSTWLKSHSGRVVTNFQIRAIFDKAYQDRIQPEKDSTAAKNLAGPPQVAESSSTSLIIASTSAANNPRPLTAAQYRDIVTAIPTTPTSSKMILQDMYINVPIRVLTPVPKGIYVAGQGNRKPHKKLTVLLLVSTPNIEEAKAKSTPPPVPNKKTRKATRALDFSSYKENDLFSFLETGDDDDDSVRIYCNDL
ncbi:hypothetical protein WA026_007630 [Henosepilachna vigintioctopunctata]|uniref:Uncharacterized protein n=1 Tax=Henosepilachna vigintioctopunctata TaxID=420089 RepID=A0AAW1U2T7_9CUCU